MMYVSNAFSISMLPYGGNVRITPINAKTAARILQDGFVSAIGHADIANVVSNELGVQIGVNRINVVLDIDDALIVAQYIGPRLAEGATRLPEGAKIAYYLVTVEQDVDIAYALKNLAKKSDVRVRAAILYDLIEREMEDAGEITKCELDVVLSDLLAIIEDPSSVKTVFADIEERLAKIAKI